MTETPNTTTTSDRFKLDWLDVGKALIIAILTPALLIVQQSLDAGVMTFNWKQIAMASVAGGVGYLIKNFFTPSQTVLK
jgi:hypothetical protein